MLANGIKQSTTTTGPGNLTLAAITGYPTIASKYAVGTSAPMFPYAIIRDSDGVGVEWGWGRMSSSTVMVRERISATWDGTTYNDTTPSAVTLGSGPYTVIVGMHAFSHPQAVIGVDPNISGTKYLPPGQMVGNPSASHGAFTGDLPCIPFRLDVGGLCTGVSVKVVATGSTLVRGAVYAMNKDGSIGALLAESTAGVSMSTSGVKQLTFASGIRLSPGWYYVAIVFSASNGTIQGTNVAGAMGICPMWGTNGGDPQGRYNLMYRSVTYADSGSVFPNPFGTPSSISADWVGTCPIISMMMVNT